MKQLENLIAAVKKSGDWPKEAETITVSKTGQTAGAAYEKLRNAVEYEEEHLLRRNAIRRILMRRVHAADVAEMSRGEALLTELIWAKYLPNKKVPLTMIGVIDKIIKKYDRLFEEVPDEGEAKKHTTEWLFDVMSTEIEYALEPPHAYEALSSYMFDRIRKELVWEAGKGLDESQKDMLVYVAIYRALMKCNLATLRYRVFMLYFPKWSKATGDAVGEVAGKLQAVMAAVDGQIKHPLADQLFRLMRRYSHVFRVIKDIVKKNPDSYMDVVNSDEKLLAAVRTSAYARYDKFGKKRTRTVARAVLFLLLTKMILALIIEVPYEYFVLGHIAAIPLAINILFHPVFLAIIGLTVKIPAKKNTKRIMEYVKAVLSGKDEALGIVFKVKKPWTQGVLGKFFTGIYVLTYVVSYGLIAWVLTALLDFNVISTILFLFFFSLVTFFGIKIRQSMQELLVIERQGSVLGTLFDFFLMPVVRAGRWLSLRARDINIFVFFLDYIAEAPIKLGIELIEGWIAFVKTQKEEL